MHGDAAVAGKDSRGDRVLVLGSRRSGLEQVGHGPKSRAGGEREYGEKETADGQVIPSVSIRVSLRWRS